MEKKTVSRKRLRSFPVILFSYAVVITFSVMVVVVMNSELLLPANIDFIPVRRGWSNDPAMNFWLEQHLRWHDANRNNRSTRRLIFQTIGAGLGDHIKALVWAYGYAVLTKRLLLIDWPSPYPIETVLSDRARHRFIYRSELDSAGVGPGYGLDFNFEYRQGLTPSMLNLLVSDVHTVFLRIGPAQPPDAVIKKLRGSRWGNKTLPRFSWNARRAVTKTVLEPSSELLKYLIGERHHLALCAYHESCDDENLFERWTRAIVYGGSTLQRRQYFAVHARLGLGTNESHITRFASSLGHERQIAECFARAVKSYAAPSKDPVVFVASDTASWRLLFKDVLLKLLPRAKAVHLDQRPTHFRSIRSGSKHGRETFLNLHAEMLLIGDAQRTIAFSSGFPAVGFWRGHGRHFTLLSREQCIRENYTVG